MEFVKSADILKPAKSAAKGLMAVISGDKGGSEYVRQMVAKDCPQTSSGTYIASSIMCGDTGSDPCWGWFWVWD